MLPPEVPDGLSTTSQAAPPWSTELSLEGVACQGLHAGSLKPLESGQFVGTWETRHFELLAKPFCTCPLDPTPDQDQV